MRLYKRGGIYWYDITIKGQRVRKSTEQRNQYLAGLVLNDAMTEARTKGVDAILKKSPTLDEFSEEFLKWTEANQNITESTKFFYSSGWKMLKATKLADMPMDKITNHVCETIPFPGGPSNANRALRTLRRMFTAAKEARKFFGDIPEFKLRTEWPRSIAMSQADAQAISAHLKGDPKDVIDIMRDSTPMRPKECFSMRWEYMNMAKCIYQNPKGKTISARRAMILFDGAMAVIRRRHMEQGSPIEGWVFPSHKRSKTGHIQTIHMAFTAARDKAGLPKAMVFYTIRHGRATDLAQVTTLKELMMVGGWEDPNVAMQYQHPQTEDIKQRLAKLEAAKTSGRIQ